jgi:ABC-type branched-subunit amino acid transport system substrate-binding protein
MGTVYLALLQGPAGFNKLKVVKQLLPALADDAQFLALFLDEARLSARLNHPNIVQTDEVGFDGRDYFIRMEYLEGETLESLSRRASRTGGLPVEVALHVLAQVLAGLHYAHELTGHDGAPLGIVHRDVSPQNVFVTYEGAVKLLDFGVAKTKDSHVQTRTGVIRGKAKYMAPEQAVRGPVDRRADVFAVGVMLWQALAGRRLYEDLSDDEVLLQLRQPRIPSVRSLRPDVPRELDELVARALAVKPEDRFETAAAMQVAIEDYLAKTGAVVGPRQLAELMTKVYADRRAARQEEVDAQIRALSSGNDSTAMAAAVPLLAHSPGMRATDTDASRAATILGGSGERGRRVARVAALRAVAVSVLGAALVALAAGTLARRTTSRGCTTNAECRGRLGRAALCNAEARCAAFETADCRVLAEEANVDDDATLWFGVLLPQQGERAEAYGRTFTNSIDVARRDLMTSTGGLPSRTLGHPPRPIGLVVCDDADAARAANHLVRDLHVPALIGSGSSSELVSLAPMLFANDVLAIETRSSNALITAVPAPKGSPRLLWRTTGSAAYEGKPLAAVVERLLGPRSGRGGPDTDVPRVALVRTSSASALSVSESLVSELRVGGARITSAPDAFHQYVFQPEHPEDVVDALLDFRPAVIVALNSSFARQIATPLEARWPRGVPPPLYVFDGGAGPDDIAFLTADPGRRARYFAVDFPANTATNLKFALRYNELHSPAVTPGTAPGVAYDALFVLVYAAAAAPDGPITGSSLSRGIARLVPPGTPIDVGGGAAYRAFEALRDGQSIDLNGAGTPLDFDLATGETQADYAVYCAHLDAKGSVDDVMESGMRYSGTAGALVGDMSCP